MTTTCSQSRKCWKSVLSRPPHASKVESVKPHFFQDHHALLKWKVLKSVLSRQPHASKEESVKNQFFQDHHMLPK